MDFHVLSNGDIIAIIKYALGCAIVLSYFFSKLGARDADPTYNKGKIAIIVPWLLLLVFVSDCVPVVLSYLDYSWDQNPQPSKASALREMKYMLKGSPIWGWANDYQLKIVGSLGGCVNSLCWTVYAFSFKKSNTNWWKKTCKIIAYVLISMLIIGFSLHDYDDFISYAFILGPAFILLWIARVKVKYVSDNSSPRANSTISSSSDSVQEKLHENMDRKEPVLTGIETKDNEPNTMYCKHCGKIIADDSLFCKFCGKQIK